MASIYASRIAAVAKKLKEQQGALLLSSAPLVFRNRDTLYPYRQDSNFYYLSGSKERDLTLLISCNQKLPLLFAPKSDPKRALWEGKEEDPKKLAKTIGAELLQVDNPKIEILARLKGISTLYYQSCPGALASELAGELISKPPHQRAALPARFESLDSLLVPMRLYKTKDEVNIIKKASAITCAALDEAIPYIAPNVPEHFIQATIDYWFRVFGGESAFPTIVGSGPTAAILHYDKAERSAKKGDLMLIDCGAEYQCYASDLTRVFPVSGYFEGVQAEIYQIVLEAQDAAIKKVRHGVKVQALYDAAAQVLTQGLVDLGVLKAKASKCFQTKAYLPYFPHSISHTLGLDVHDLGNLRGNNQAVIEEGMVISVEPGLYFSTRVGKVPASGVRIEDIVYVTRKGCEVLTLYPKEMHEIMELMSASQESFESMI